MFQGDIQGNPGLEAKVGGDSRKFWVTVSNVEIWPVAGSPEVTHLLICFCWSAQAADETCGPSPERAERDQAQLAQATVEENAKKKKPKKSRYELERYASKIVKMGGDGKEEFFEHLDRRMREAGKINVSPLVSALQRHNCFPCEA